ncbi:MAG: hypothetical protein JWN02_343, partial [Acidobacteria bacterium]|nr:hypothetical protein [Acidobacteriota bacterium]
NLLLLLVVGTFERARIATFKRLKAFPTEDFDLLRAIVAKFHRLVVTPNVLTEVSNLAGGLPSNVLDACFRTFGNAILAAEEMMISSASVAPLPEFRRFGLTDATIVQVAAAPVLILTVDLDLAIHLAAQSLPVLNFNHIRYLNWR